MRSQFVIISLGMIVLNSAPSVFAQAAEKSKTTLMPEVVVSAKHEHQSLVVATPQQAEINIRKTPGGVDVINQDEYKTGQSMMITDMLGYSPGIFAQQRDTGAQEARVSIRGSGLQRTFHLRGIKLLQDGIPVNDADGGGDFYRVEPLATLYTEIYRGGNALRYGATTLGGAINFVSPTGYEADKLQTRVEGGSFGYMHSQLSSGQVLGDFDYYVSLSQFMQEGYRKHTRQDNHYEFSSFGYRINEDLESRVYFTNATVKAKLGGSLTKAQMLDDPKQANAANLSGNRKRDQDYYRVASKTTYKKDDQQFDFSFFGSKLDMFHPIFQVLDIDSTNFGAEARYSTIVDVWGYENELTAGEYNLFDSIHTVDYKFNLRECKTIK